MPHSQSAQPAVSAVQCIAQLGRPAAAASAVAPPRFHFAAGAATADGNVQDKAAFTRAFNQQHIKPRTGFGMDDKLNKKKGGGAKGRKAARPADDDEDAFGGGYLVWLCSPAVAAAAGGHWHAASCWDAQLWRLRVLKGCVSYILCCGGIKRNRTVCARCAAVTMPV